MMKCFFILLHILLFIIMSCGDDEGLDSSTTTTTTTTRTTTTTTTVEETHTKEDAIGETTQDVSTVPSEQHLVAYNGAPCVSYDGTPAVCGNYGHDYPWCYIAHNGRWERCTGSHTIKKIVTTNNASEAVIITAPTQGVSTVPSDQQIIAYNGAPCVSYDGTPAVCGHYGLDYPWCYTTHNGRWERCPDITLNDEELNDPSLKMKNKQVIWYVVWTIGVLVLIAVAVLCMIYLLRHFDLTLVKGSSRLNEVSVSDNIGLESATGITNSQYEPDRSPQNITTYQHGPSRDNDEFYDDTQGKYTTTRNENSSTYMEETHGQITAEYYNEVMDCSDTSSDEEEFQYDGYFDEEENKLCKIFPDVDLQIIKSTIHISSGNVELAASRLRENLALNSEGLLNEKTNSKVVVLNYRKFPVHIPQRPGAGKDSKNLFQIFTHLGYEVEICTNLTAFDTEDVLRKLQMYTTYKSLILIIISHGKNRNCFYTSEGGIMDLDIIRKKFTDTACPGLKGKSKIILANFCRGQDMEYQTDAIASVEVPHHMVTIHASVENIKVLRHPRRGTIFISSLCKVLKKNQELREMYNELYKKMKEEGGTTPMMEVFAPLPEFRF